MHKLILVRHGESQWRIKTILYLVTSKQVLTKE